MLFWHRLAFEFKATVEELKERMQYREFLRWIEWAELYPFGPEHEDNRIAMLSARIVSAVTGSPQKLDDHRLKYRSSKKMSPKKQLMMLQSIKASLCQTPSK